MEQETEAPLDALEAEDKPDDESEGALGDGGTSSSGGFVGKSRY